ncbi:MAG TPA: hypothetical protein PK059_10650, partial [Cyclobacteriaceae bacterium]|nr:hypothetical protein [Cyclobacteriaceae bacterium]
SLRSRNMGSLRFARDDGYGGNNGCWRIASLRSQLVPTKLQLYASSRAWRSDPTLRRRSINNG